MGASNECRTRQQMKRVDADAFGVGSTTLSAFKCHTSIGTCSSNSSGKQQPPQKIPTVKSFIDIQLTQLFFVVNLNFLDFATGAFCYANWFKSNENKTWLRTQTKWPTNGVSFQPNWRILHRQKQTNFAFGLLKQVKQRQKINFVRRREIYICPVSSGWHSIFFEF